MDGSMDARLLLHISRTDQQILVKFGIVTLRLFFGLIRNFSLLDHLHIFTVAILSFLYPYFF